MRIHLKLDVTPGLRMLSTLVDRALTLRTVS
jgi:hypothetical protein